MRVSGCRGELKNEMGMIRLATPGNENRADETNPILAFQGGIREHEESMTYNHILVIS
jgi:hypothetical protein